MNLRQLFSIRQTPQHQPIPGANQTLNEAGGYVWAVDDWTTLDRFLILGSESGAYYIGPRELTAPAWASRRENQIQLLFLIA